MTQRIIDIIVHSPTEFALQQWLDARELGLSYQDVDPTSPTFGDWFYKHYSRTSDYVVWNGDGKMIATKTPAGTGEEGEQLYDYTYYQGFYTLVRFIPVDEELEDTFPEEDKSLRTQAWERFETWVNTSTAISILDGFEGVGGEGVTILAPDIVNDHLVSLDEGGVGHAGGQVSSDPRLWYLSPVMIGDQREFEGVTYESLIDYNYTTPPNQFWNEVVVTLTIEPWEQRFAAPYYQLGDQVTHNGLTWESTFSGNNVWEPGVFGWAEVT